jgi:hypothetical protein
MEKQAVKDKSESKAGGPARPAVAGADKQGNGELFYAPERILKQANVPEYEALYRRSLKDPQAFWAERAAELEWFRPWDRVLDDSEKPFYKWFTGGKTNIVYNALDRHLKTPRKNKVALIWEGEPGDTRMYSYASLNREVCKFANVLKSLGVKKGHIVTIYLPRIPNRSSCWPAPRSGPGTAWYTGASAWRPWPSASRTPRARC